MPKEYDFSTGKRGTVIEAFRAKAEASGEGYQTMMSNALRTAIDPESAPVTLRAVLDERFIGSGKN